MAKQISAVKTGMDREEAYEKLEGKRDGASGLLLRALDELFKQVSTKNKELKNLNKLLEKKVEERTKELNIANKYLKELSYSDILTSLPNRRFAMKTLNNIWNDSINNKSSIVCIMIDADHFKEVNDTYGHDAGDAVLIELANTLRESFRNDDVVCRLGGDEFFVILPNTNYQGGMKIAEKVRQKISKLRIKTGAGIWVGSVSIGVSTNTYKITNPEDLIKKADEALYMAKQAGKNCVR